MENIKERKRSRKLVLRDELSKIRERARSNDWKILDADRARYVEIQTELERIEAAVKDAKKQKALKNLKFRQIFEDANKEGMKAVDRLQVTPMVVVSKHGDKIVREVISEGVCGFAWINIRPANSPFAKWVKDIGYGRPDSYYGGVTIWVSAFNQSMEKKQEYAGAFAAWLILNGISAVADSRLD